jgi:hypothetical protein
MKTSWAFAVLCLALIACGGDDLEQGAVFRRAEGQIEISGAVRLNAALQLVDNIHNSAFATSFFSRVQGEDSQFLDIWLETPDASAMLVLNAIIKGEGEYKTFTPEAGSTIHLFLGEACEGGDGDVFGADCLWYSSLFDPVSCILALDSVSQASLRGRLDCAGMAANCFETGQRQADGRCVGGKDAGRLTVAAQFELTEPDTSVPVPRVGSVE